MKDADILADVVPSGDCITNELFAYVALDLYEELAGKDIPRNQDIDGMADPAGENWDFTDPGVCAAKLPRSWAKFGDQ